MITPESDTSCRDLGAYLMEGLNAIDTRTAVAAIADYYPFIGGEATVDSPLLCVFRGNSDGAQLDRSELNIAYYLFDLEAYREQPGTLRWIELAIVSLLGSYNYQQECLKLDLATLRSRRGYLPYGNLLLPNTVLSLTAIDYEGL